MKGRAWTAAILALLMMGATAKYLATHHERQRLGPPGVRLVPEPILVFDDTNPTNPPARATNNSHSVFLPPHVPRYYSQEAPVSAMMLQVLPKDTTFGRRFYYRERKDLSIDCQVVLMGADRTSIHQPQFCLQGSGFVTLSSEATTIRISRPHPYDLPVMKLKLRRDGMDKDGNRFATGGMFVYWFVADGELTADHMQRQWWLARDLIQKGVLQRWAYVICSKSCPVGAEEETFEEMKEFIADAVPEFQLTTGSRITTVASQ